MLEVTSPPVQKFFYNRTFFVFFWTGGDITSNEIMLEVKSPPVKKC
jgi:hypothetical protein